MTFYIVANAAGGGLLQPGLSGGDRIVIECIKRWEKMGHKITVFLSKSGLVMFSRYGLKNVNFVVTSQVTFGQESFLNILVFELSALIHGFSSVLGQLEAKNGVVVYSASDFWPDSLPALIIKKRVKNVKLIASLNLFAPSPFKDSVYRGRHFLKGVVYYLSQKLVYQLIRKYADMVFVTNEFDRWRFIDEKRLTPDRVIAVRGGVDTKSPLTVPEPEKKVFDAVFIGRFHPQKGVLELMDIWKYVCKRKEGAKLAMIGVGELEGEVKVKIREYGLENNVVLLGFKDGVEKLRIFKDSKVVVHPAIYDSGGMAACEAMACGLPGVSFDLPALKTYYPKGMLKTPCFDLEAFVENILKLLEDEKLYQKTAKDALDWAQEWDWDKRAEFLLEKISDCLQLQTL
jgi:glycosyltransferase involved in cell wall biosynthesis